VVKRTSEKTIGLMFQSGMALLKDG